MVYCRNCGARLEDNTVYCPKCGTAVPPQPSYRPSRHTNVSFNLALGAAAAVMAVGIILVALFATGLIPSQAPFGGVTGSGNVQTQQIEVSNFTKLDVGSGFTVQVTQANTYSVSITADDNVFPYIQASRTGDTLIIRIKPLTAVTTTALKANITMPDIAEAQVTSGATSTVNGFNLAHDFKADLSGGSRLTMTGQAVNMEAIGSGGSNLQLRDFQVNNAKVDLSGGSQAIINLSGILDAELNGGSRLMYVGNATLGEIHTSSGSTVSQIT